MFAEPLRKTLAETVVKEMLLEPAFLAIDDGHGIDQALPTNELRLEEAEHCPA